MMYKCIIRMDCENVTTKKKLNKSTQTEKITEKQKIISH